MMENPKSNPVFILKVIGTLFGIVTLLLFVLILWLVLESTEIKSNSDYQGFVVATGILSAATATITIFIWWIVSNKKKFLNYD